MTTRARIFRIAMILLSPGAAIIYTILLLLVVLSLAGCGPEKTTAVTKPDTGPLKESVGEVATGTRKAMDLIDNHTQEIDKAAPGLTQPPLIRAETEHVRDLMAKLDTAQGSLADVQKKCDAQAATIADLEKQLAKERDAGTAKLRTMLGILAGIGALGIPVGIGLFMLGSPKAGITAAVVGVSLSISTIATMAFIRLAEVIAEVVAWCAAGVIIAATVIGIIYLVKHWKRIVGQLVTTTGVVSKLGGDVIGKIGDGVITAKVQDEATMKIVDATLPKVQKQIDAIVTQAKAKGAA